MVGLVLAVAAGILIGLARRGSFRNLGETRLRGVPLVFAGVLLQLGSAAADRAEIARLPLALVLAAFACTFAFAALNWRLPGMGLIALGALSNFVVISANAGMPVSIDAAERAGIGNPFEDPGAFTKGAHHALDATSRLTFLADRIPMRLGANVISVGDILIWAGLLLLVQQLMVGRPGRRRHRPAERELSPR